MRTTTGRKTAQRRVGGRLRPDLETMELRIALAGSPLGSITSMAAMAQAPVPTTPQGSSLSIASTSPANSAVIATSPSMLQVTFDRPLDAFLVGGADFDLVHVAADGSTSPMLPGEAQLGESLDPDGDQVDLALSSPLAPGRYRLLLDPDSQLEGLDGSSLAHPGAGLVVSDFTTGPTHEGGIGSAVEIGALGPSEAVAPGRLDLVDDPGAVQYYKFELAPGHHWLVGLEVSARGDGGTLDSSLSVFDAQGHLISEANEGLPDDPQDPYLFAGLDPGTYYVGVAAARNLPDASGTYDPAASAVVPGNTGGPFQLQAVADVADQPTKVLGLRLDHADPLSPDPTGLTLQFSGGLDLAGLEGADSHPLTLVDRSGATWSLTPTGYDAADGQLSLAFDHPLAPGSYALELAGPGRLLDLAGRPPVADGLPSGTLGTFSVASSARVAGDLGAVLPGLGSSGLGATLGVAPGRATTGRVAIVEPGVYTFNASAASGGLSVSVEDNSGDVLASGQADSGSVEVVANLVPGTYQVVLTGTAARGSAVAMTITQRVDLASSLLESGVGQGPALGLRLVTPQANFGQGSDASTAQPLAGPPAATAAPASTGLAGHSGPTAGAPSAVGGFVAVAVGLATPAGPSVAGVTLGSGPVGRPSSQASPIGVVGPGGPTGLAAIASNSDDLPAGLIAATVPTDGDDQVEPAPSPGRGASPGRSTSPRAGVTLEAGLLARSPGSRREDDRTLADADWIGQLFANALPWAGGADPRAVVEAVAASGAVGARSTHPGPSSATGPAPVEESRLESASVASPFALGVTLGVIAFRSRRRLFRKGGPTGVAGSMPTARPLLAGPHRRPIVRVGADSAC